MLGRKYYATIQAHRHEHLGKVLYYFYKEMAPHQEIKVISVDPKMVSVYPNNYYRSLHRIEKIASQVGFQTIFTGLHKKNYSFKYIGRKPDAKLEEDA